MARRPVTVSTLGIILVAAASVVAACSSRPVAGGDAGPDRPPSGSAGAGGAATAGTGGASGAAGPAGASGGAGVTGAGGAAGTTGASAGRGGGGGATGSAPECAAASDCKLVSDCCTCQAIPIGATAPACSSVCKQPQCAALQLPQGAVDCVAGRCVAGFACDASQVICKVAVPTCPAGEVPTVNESGNCYLGTCAPAPECTRVTGCGSCTGAADACVTYQTQLGNQNHCVTIPPECGGSPGCGCLGAASCLPPYRSCTEYSGIKGVACSCPNC